MGKMSNLEERKIWKNGRKRWKRAKAEERIRGKREDERKR